jgi:putative intracellular protease/amidase
VIVTSAPREGTTVSIEVKAQINGRMLQQTRKFIVNASESTAVSTTVCHASARCCANKDLGAELRHGLFVAEGDHGVDGGGTAGGQQGC